MGKHRNTYRTFTTSMLKTRSSIPALSDIVEQTGYIDCSNIKISDVKNILEENSYSLVNLCKSNKVNLWSNFSPYLKSYGGISTFDASLKFTAPTECKLGDFAGYNHTAAAPGWQSGGKADAETTIWVKSGEKANITAKVNLGEIDYDSATGIDMLVFDEFDAIKGWGQTDYSAIGSNFYLNGSTNDAIVIDKTYRGRAFLTDIYPIAQPEDVQSAILCMIPNVSDWSINIKVKIQSELWLAGTKYTGGAGGNLTVGDEHFVGIYFNAAAGTISFNDFKSVTAGLDGLKIHVQVLDWLDQVQSSGNMYDTTNAPGPAPDYGDYTSNNLIVSDLGYTITAYDAGPDDYSYGYRFFVTILKHA